MFPEEPLLCQSAKGIKNTFPHISPWKEYRPCAKHSEGWFCIFSRSQAGSQTLKPLQLAFWIPMKSLKLVHTFLQQLLLLRKSSYHKKHPTPIQGNQTCFSKLTESSDTDCHAVKLLGKTTLQQCHNDLYAPTNWTLFAMQVLDSSSLKDTHL